MAWDTLRWLIDVGGEDVVDALWELTQRVYLMLVLFLLLVYPVMVFLLEPNGLLGFTNNTISMFHPESRNDSREENGSSRCVLISSKRDRKSNIRKWAFFGCDPRFIFGCNDPKYPSELWFVPDLTNPLLHLKDLHHFVVVHPNRKGIIYLYIDQIHLVVSIETHKSW